MTVGSSTCVFLCKFHKFLKSVFDAREFAELHIIDFEKFVSTAAVL